jgi:hypothetical protein
MSKTTAVEWLVKTLELDTRFHGIMIDAINKAKEMEKGQIVDAVDGFPLDKRHLDGEQYYNETYKGGNNE